MRLVVPDINGRTVVAEDRFQTETVIMAEKVFGGYHTAHVNLSSRLQHLKI